MPYTFEVTFTGLCIFTFQGDKRKPQQVNALLPYTLQMTGSHRHIPYLGFRAENLQYPPPIPPDYRLAPGYDGSQTSLLSLAGKEVRIIIPDEVHSPLTPTWRPQNGEDLPESPEGISGAEQWLDWAMALQRMNPETPDPDTVDPFGGLKKEKITSRIVLDKGVLEARGFPRMLESADYQLWDFDVPPDGNIHSKTVPSLVANNRSAAAEPSAIGPYAMARSIVLKFDNIPDDKAVRIIAVDLEVALRPLLPTEKLLQASITNLPEINDPGEADLTHLIHFAHFYEPVTFLPPAPKLRLPHPRGAIITSGTSFCPPTTHTKAE